VIFIPALVCARFLKLMVKIEIDDDDALRTILCVVESKIGCDSIIPHLRVK
jgi:hypothetical protein